MAGGAAARGVHRQEGRQVRGPARAHAGDVPGERRREDLRGAVRTQLGEGAPLPEAQAQAASQPKKQLASTGSPVPGSAAAAADPYATPPPAPTTAPAYDPYATPPPAPTTPPAYDPYAAPPPATATPPPAPAAPAAPEFDPYPAPPPPPPPSFWISTRSRGGSEVFRVATGRETNRRRRGGCEERDFFSRLGGRESRGAQH